MMYWHHLIVNIFLNFFILIVNTCMSCNSMSSFLPTGPKYLVVFWQNQTGQYFVLQQENGTYVYPSIPDGSFLVDGINFCLQRLGISPMSEQEIRLRLLTNHGTQIRHVIAGSGITRRVYVYFTLAVDANVGTSNLIALNEKPDAALVKGLPLLRAK